MTDFLSTGTLPDDIFGAFIGSLTIGIMAGARVGIAPTLVIGWPLHLILLRTGFVHLATQAVTHKFAHYAIAMSFGIFLNGIAHIFNAVARSKFANTHIQRFFGYLQKFARGRIHLANFKSISVVAVKFVFEHPTIHRYNIAFFNRAVGRKPMYHLFVYTREQSRRATI